MGALDLACEVLVEGTEPEQEPGDAAGKVPADEWRSRGLFPPARPGTGYLVLLKCGLATVSAVMSSAGAETGTAWRSEHRCSSHWQLNCQQCSSQLIVRDERRRDLPPAAQGRSSRLRSAVVRLAIARAATCPDDGAEADGIGLCGMDVCTLIALNLVPDFELLELIGRGMDKPKLQAMCAERSIEYEGAEKMDTLRRKLRAFKAGGVARRTVLSF